MLSTDNIYYRFNIERRRMEEKHFCLDLDKKLNERFEFEIQLAMI